MKTVSALLALVLLGACSTTPNYDRHFGEAVRQARLAMIIDPRAGEKAGPPAGIDGVAAREALIRYQDGFKEPPPVVNVINIGGVATK
jgi:hypothetical protein